MDGNKKTLEKDVFGRKKIVVKHRGVRIVRVLPGDRKHQNRRGGVNRINQNRFLGARD